MRVKFFGISDLNVLPIKDVPIRKRLLGWKNEGQYGNSRYYL